MKQAPYQAIFAAQRLGFVVKRNGAMFYIEGPGNDGRGIFNNWYLHDREAWTAVTRYVRRQGLVAPPEPAAPISPAAQLAYDLWWFIENVTDEASDRQDRFFALRERVRGLRT